jgi:hypothetical protein
MEQGLDLISWDELENYADANPAEWFIPDIMQSYSFNVFCGWPKAGKSSYTRNLIACVIGEGDFLKGLKVQQGAALYVTTEQGKTAIRNEMNKFGIDREVMREKFILSAFSPQTPAEFVQKLAVSLKNRPDIKLVVLDTLADFLPGLNLDNYTEVKPRLGDFVRLCEEQRVTILALHHFNKAGTTLLASIAGSQAIAASADTIMGIWGTEDRPRYFEATSRNGSFPRTRLLIDKMTGKVSLDDKGASSKDTSEVAMAESKIGNVLEIIKENPGITQKELIVRMEGRKADKFGEIKKLKTEGLIVESGKGCKGDPITFTAASAPVSNPVPVGIAVVPTPAPNAPAPTASLDDQILTLSAKIRTERDSEHKAELMGMRADLQAKKKAAA